MTDIRKLPLKRQGYTVYDVTGSDFCYCPGISVEDSHNRAAFIVTACNAHADLLDVCKKLLSAMDGLLGQTSLETEIDTPVLLRCQDAASMAEVLLAQEGEIQ